MSDPQVPAQPDPATQPTQPVPPAGQQPTTPLPPQQPPLPPQQPVYAYPAPPQAAPPPPVQPGWDSGAWAQQPYGAATATLPPQPQYAPVPPQQPAGGGHRRGVLLGLGAVLAGLVLLLAGFGLGRATAPSGGPTSLVDAVRMAQQGTLPCGTAGPNDRVGGFIARLCQLTPGQNGPGLGGLNPFGGNRNGTNPGNGNGSGSGSGNGNGSGNGSGSGSGSSSGNGSGTGSGA